MTGSLFLYRSVFEESLAPQLALLWARGCNAVYRFEQGLFLINFVQDIYVISHFLFVHLGFGQKEITHEVREHDVFGIWLNKD